MANSDRRSHFVVLAVALVATASCVSVMTSQLGRNLYMPMFVRAPQCPYREVELITVTGGPDVTESALDRHLIDEAARLGADALVDLKQEGPTGWRFGRSKSGVAVIFTDSTCAVRRPNRYVPPGYYPPPAATDSGDHVRIR
jgi:hypothetical protein